MAKLERLFLRRVFESEKVNQKFGEFSRKPSHLVGLSGDQKTRHLKVSRKRKYLYSLYVEIELIKQNSFEVNGNYKSFFLCFEFSNQPDER